MPPPKFTPTRLCRSGRSGQSMLSGNAMDTKSTHSQLETPEKVKTFKTKMFFGAGTGTGSISPSAPVCESGRGSGSGTRHDLNSRASVKNDATATAAGGVVIIRPKQLAQPKPTPKPTQKVKAVAAATAKSMSKREPTLMELASVQLAPVQCHNKKRQLSRREIIHGWWKHR